MTENKEGRFPVQTIELDQEQLESLKILNTEAHMYSASLIDLKKQLSGESILHQDVKETLIETQNTMRMLEFATYLFEKKTPLKIVHENWPNPRDQMYKLTDTTNWPHGGLFNNKQINRLFDVLWPDNTAGRTENSDKIAAKASLSLRREVILKPQV